MDAAGRTARRDLTLDVFEGEPSLPILAIPANGACATGGFTLSVPGSFSASLWSPGAQTTSTITACPEHPAVYSVVVTGVDGCRRRGGIELAPYTVAPATRMPVLIPDDRRRLPIRKN